MFSNMSERNSTSRPRADEAHSIVMAQAAVEQQLAASAGITLSNAQAVAASRTKLFQIAQASLNKTLMANPYVAIAAAVTALGYGIYKLVTYQTDAEKAQSKLNEKHLYQNNVN